MIKIILLNDAVVDRTTVFAKAVVENNGFMIEIGVGLLKKEKAHTANKGDIAMQLPLNMLDKLSIKQVHAADKDGVLQFNEDGTPKVIPFIHIG